MIRLCLQMLDSSHCHLDAVQYKYLVHYCAAVTGPNTQHCFINSKLLSVVCGSIKIYDALSMIIEVHDDASDFTIYLRQSANKHDGYKNYNNLVSKWMITIIVFIIT